MKKIYNFKNDFLIKNMDQFKQRNLENECIREKSMTFDLFKQKMDRTIFQDDYGFSEYLKDKIIFNTDTPNIGNI